MKAKRDYYAGAKRVVKDGVPCRVASWYSDLSAEGQRAIGGDCRIRTAPYPRNGGLTKIPRTDGTIR